LDFGLAAMLIFDQLKKDDPELRVVALGILGGLGVLLAGLWWVQIVSARDYRESLQTQSFRTVRIPAVRGKILDRNGAVLAENRPTYNVSLYLEELRKPFKEAEVKELAGAQAELKQRLQEAERSLGRKLSKTERKQFMLAGSQKEALRQKAHYEVASNVVAQVSLRIQQPLWLAPTNFQRHYESRLALPLPVLQNLDPTNIARFEEQSTSPMGVDLEVQSTRIYPHGTSAAHLLGHLKRDDSSAEGEESFFSYRLPDYRGAVGIEAGFDRELRGMAGAKSVLVNNIGYRQTENVWTPAEPGHDVILTIDLRIQQAAEHALEGVFGPQTRGAVVVMNVRNGDILAMASSPTLNPNSFIPRISSQEYQHIAEIGAEKNRATFENYMPGSVFKTVVGLAALEAGWNPETQIYVEANPADPQHGYIKVSGHPVKDTAIPGDYNFRRAIVRSSNAYFIRAGLFAGPDRILRLARHLHFGEKTALPNAQEAPGKFPGEIERGWTDRQTANISIGQDPVWVTPLQIAVLTSALANGGKVLWPRLVDRVEPQDPTLGEAPVVYPHQPPRDELGVSARSMRILHEAMVAETEDAEGTGHPAALLAPGLRICGKTGTAQVQDVRGTKIGQTTWFASFAPYSDPRWAVVVMVENGVSGGTSCSPVAGHVYQAILDCEKADAAKGATLARSEVR
jgi:penicillin-binding protein 2